MPIGDHISSYYKYWKWSLILGHFYKSFYKKLKSTKAGGLKTSIGIFKSRKSKFEPTLLGVALLLSWIVALLGIESLSRLLKTVDLSRGFLRQCRAILEVKQSFLSFLNRLTVG